MDFFCCRGVFALRSEYPGTATGGQGKSAGRVVESLVGDLRRVVFPACSWGLRFPVWPLGGARRIQPGKIVLRNLPGTLARIRAIAHAVALTLAFALLSALHVVSETGPKTISLSRAERVALLIALPSTGF